MDRNIDLFKIIYPMYSFFEKMWREAPGTRSPSFLISLAEMPDTVSMLSEINGPFCLKLLTKVPTHFHVPTP